MKDIALILDGLVASSLNEMGSAVRRPTRVLVVDDEWLIAGTVAAILRREGYAAFSYVDPLEALKASELLAPDVLISDIAMPELSGVDLALQMKARYPQCKILLFSGRLAPPDALEKARTSGHEFLLLPKPVHPTVLLSEIAQLTER